MSLRPLSHALAGLALLTCFAPAAHAQDAAPSLRPVQIEGNYDTAVGSSDAASQGSVTGKLIANRPTSRTGEILEFVPGLIVSQHSGDGKANQYYLRGFNLDHGTDFATWVDGVPVNMRTNAHGQGYSDLNFLIPELVTRIDFKKGPYFADEGDFASAGAAHLRIADTLPAGLASLTVGANQYTRAVLANSMPWANGHLLYGLELSHNNGPWSNPEQARKASGVLRYASGTSNDGFNITGMAYQSSWRSTDQIPVRAVDAGLIGRFGSVDPSDGGQSSRYSLSYAMRRRNEAGLFELNAYVLRSSLTLASNFTYFMDNPVSGDQFQQSERRTMSGLNASQTWATKWAGLDVLNKFGLQTRFDQLSPVGLYSSVNGVRTGVISESQVREGSLAIYGENTVQWHEKFRTVAGLRLDAYAFNVSSNNPANSGRTSAQIASPKLSMIFGPWAKTEYFVNIGRGFHSNDARGTTLTITPKEGLPVAPVTPLVRSEGAELGVRSEIVPGLQSSLALWSLRIASELVFSGDAGDTSPSRPSRRSGIEWNNHYVPNDWLLVDADVSISRARHSQNDPAGNFIPGSVERVASIGATVTEWKGWSGGLQLRYFGPRPLIEDNSVRSAGTFMTNLRVGYRVAPGTRLIADVFNLFNRRASDIDYYYASQLRGEAAPVNGVVFHPVEPRTLRISLLRNF
jgi:hypothetical protein